MGGRQAEVLTMATLRDALNANVREGELYEKLDRGFVRCFACGHCCRIP